MKRFLVVALLAIAACENDTAGVELEHCTGGCEGLAVRVDSVRITLPPGQQTVYSADTLTAHVFLTNTGSAVADSLTQVALYNFSSGFGTTRIGGLAPGASKRFDVRVSFTRYSWSLRSRDSLYLEVYREGESVPHGYQFLAERWTPSYSYSPTTLRLANVPPVLYLPGEANVQLVVSNPGPRPLTSDSLAICAFDLDYCFAEAQTPAPLPDIPAGATRTIDLPVKFVRTPFHAMFLENLDIALRLCYYPEGDFVCTSEDIAFRPNFEAFCAVRRLTVGETIFPSAVGRGCGLGVYIDRLDVSSFEAVAGATYEIAVQASAGPMSVHIRDAAARILGDAQSLSSTTNVTATSNGRIYVIVNTASTFYSLRVTAR